MRVAMNIKTFQAWTKWFDIIQKTFLNAFSWTYQIWGDNFTKLELCFESSNSWAVSSGSVNGLVPNMHQHPLLITVTSWWARWRLKSQEYRLLTQPFVEAHFKENTKALRHWPSWGELPHKESVPRKMFPFDDVIMWINVDPDLWQSSEFSGAFTVFFDSAWGLSVPFEKKEGNSCRSNEHRIRCKRGIPQSRFWSAIHKRVMPSNRRPGRCFTTLRELSKWVFVATYFRGWK